MSTAAVRPAAPSRAGNAPLPAANFAALALQLLLVLLVVRLFRIEERRGLFPLGCLAAAGWLVHRRLTPAARPAFFLALSLAGLPLAFAWPHLVGKDWSNLSATDWSRATSVAASQSAWVFGLGAGFIALCHLPIPAFARIGLILSAAAGLAAWRAEDVSPFWAVLGSIFMFRLWIYLRELRRETRPAPWPHRLSYFFLLPNAFFPFFPIIDYRRFRDGFTADPDGAVAQRGLSWIVRGIAHLLIYRAIKLHLLPGPLDLIDAEYVGLYLVTNYALYLRISGHFHVITGLLHLFGYDLPRTHDRYFLASSLSDIWRRINIYWKDFLGDHVFFPAFFAFRRLPRWAAVVAAVLVTFAATWVLHSWQTFWLLGHFPIEARDAALWLSAGTLVAVNSLWQYRAVTRGRPEPAELTAALALRRSFQVAGTFMAVSLFWACWTLPGFPKLLAAVAQSGGFRPEKLVTPTAVLLGAITLGTVIQLSAVRLRATGIALRLPLERSPGACLAALVALVAVGSPEVNTLLGREAVQYITSIQSDSVSPADALEGYYEQLAEANQQADPLLDVASRGAPAEGVAYGAVSVARPGVIGAELKPGVRASVYGVPFRVNRWGMRDDDTPRPKPPGTYRVALLGSSTTMGHGVPQDEDFESLLETRIARAIPPGGSRIEFLNFAGPGYYALHSAGVLREKAFAFDPDAAYYVAHQGEYFGLPKHLTQCAKSDVPLPYACLDAIVRKADVTDDTSWGLAEIQLRPYAKQMVACVYRGMVEDCRRRAVVPVWVYVPIPGVTQVTIDEAELKNLARRAGFVVVDLTGWDAGHRPADLKFAESDYHANGRGHRLIADRLFDTLRSLPEALPPLAAASERRQ